MEFILKHKIFISRFLGAILLVGGLVAMFWQTPKEGLSENEKAAMRVARMEASVVSKSSVTQDSEKPNSIFMQNIKAKQEEHLRYMVILSIVFGIGFLIYSFIKKDESQE